MFFAIATASLFAITAGLILRIKSNRRSLAALRELADSEERYRTLFEFTTDGVICHGADGRVISANAAAESILGMSVVQMKAGSAWEIWRNMTDANGRSLALEEIPCHIAMRENRHVRDVFVGARHGNSGEPVWLQFESIPIQRAGKKTPDQVIVVFMDATSNRQTEDRFRVIIDSSPNALLMVDKSGIIALANSATTTVFGYSQEELLGKNVDMLVPDSFRKNHVNRRMQYEKYSNTLANGTLGELTGQHKSGALIPVDIGLRPISTLEGQFTLATIVNVSELREAQRKMSHLAFYDDLTGLPNRRFFFDRLQHAISVGARHQHVGALLYLDVDNFKAINDTMGHDAGDLLLKAVADRLRNVLRTSDTVARIGGDEFVILLEELDPHSNAAPTYAREVGLKVLDQLRIPYQIRGQVLACSASIGVVMWSGHPDEDVTSLLKRSDMAMYGAKREGKDAVRFYDPTMQQATEMRVQLEANLRRALAVGQFLAYFQRRVGFDGSVVGAEVLLRWQHPNDGLVPPASFIPVAEETGLIVPIGKWVLEQACRQLFAWGKSEHTRELFLSVNVSAIEFKQDAFVDEVVSIVRINNVNPVLLELEITESMLFENVNTFIAKMTELRNFGIRFSLDDFGTGYSSLSYLKKLPLNALKIDKSFVNDIETEPNDETIIQTIIKMGQTLGLEVVAEGVETSAQFELLKYHGCRTYQGYLFGKPLPIGDFEAALLNDAATFVPT